MHIIFGYVSHWNIPLLRIIKYFKPNVFYLEIDAKTEIKKNKIATKLKKNNIYPLPIELEKKISYKLDYSLCDHQEFAYKKNFDLVPDRIIQKYCELFSIDKKKTNKLRLLIQDFIANKKESLGMAGTLPTWCALNKSKKILYVGFKFICFYMPKANNNVFKIIIPLDLLNYLTKIVKKIFSIFSKQKKELYQNTNDQFFNMNEENFKKFEKKNVAFVVHNGLIYGTKDRIIFEKSLYYSDDENSFLNKNNILHLDYSNFSSPEQNLNWICLKKMKVSKTKILLKTILASVKTLILIRNWSEFLGWLFCIQQYNRYLKYCSVIEKFKNLKIALIDYDVLCPKTLILALEKNNVKTIATQERFIHTFYTPDANLIVDTYYVVSEFAANHIKNSKYYDVKNLIPVGLYRSDYLTLYKKKNIPAEILEAKKNDKKIIIVSGYSSPHHWFESYTSITKNWSSQINFLEDIIKLSKLLKNSFIVLRYKEIGWLACTHFKEILNKINECENIIISDNYKEAFYAYKLCANADLVIAKHTSLADECLTKEIPVLFYEYSHNLTKMTSAIFNYLSSNLMCHNFEELLERSNSLLFDSSSKLKDEIKKLNETIYHVKNLGEKENIKNRILSECSQIIQAS